MNTLVLLIDFEGHPALGNEYINNLRYSTLIDLFMDLEIDRDKIMFVSNSMCEKLHEVKSFGISKGFNWLDVESNASVPALIKTLKRESKFKLDKEKTNVIFGGTNTSGCVLGAKPMGARSFARAGYKCKLYLPMCADYFIKGLNEVDKIMYSMAAIYKSLKENNAIENIDLITSKKDLELIYV